MRKWRNDHGNIRLGMAEETPKYHAPLGLRITVAS